MSAQQKLDFIISLTDRISAPLNKVMKTLDTVTTRTQKGFTKIGFGTAGLVGIGYAIDKLTGKSIGFESAMADVRKTVDGLDPAGLKLFGDQLLKMSHTIPISAEGLAQIAAGGGQLGIAKNNLMAFTEMVAKMSTAFDMMPDAASEASAKLMNIFHLPIGQMGLLGDAINSLDNNMAAKSRDIIDVLARIGGMSQMIGLTAQQSSALSSAMLSLGQTPEIASTSINALLLKLGTARNQSKDFVGALGDIGLSVDKLEANLKAGPQQAINDFLLRIAKLDKSAQLNTLGQLFGAEYADNIAILVGGLDKYRDALTLVNKQSNFQNSMQNEFLIRSQTTANQLQLLKNHWDHLLVNAGTIFLPMLNAGIEKLNNFLDPIIAKTSQWGAQYPLLTKLIGYATGGVFALMGAVALASIGMGVWAVAAGGLAAVMAIVSSPIFLVVAAATALAFAIQWGADKVTYLIANFRVLAGTFLETIGVFGLVDSALVAWEKLKAWWANFKAWLAGLDPFVALLGGINSLLAKVASIGGAIRSSLSLSSLSTAPKAPSGPGLMTKISNAVNNSSRSTTVNVNNHGQAMSGAKLVNQMKLAGG